jgi:hypothetical protein
MQELRNPKNLEQFRKDVSEANIFIASLIFVQEASVAMCMVPDGDVW